MRVLKVRRRTDKLQRSSLSQSWRRGNCAGLCVAQSRHKTLPLDKSLRLTSRDEGERGRFAPSPRLRASRPIILPVPSGNTAAAGRAPAFLAVRRSARIRLEAVCTEFLAVSSATGKSLVLKHLGPPLYIMGGLLYGEDTICTSIISLYLGS